MKALIKIIHNTAKGTYHPIWYTEKFFPGGANENLTRYKSRGHHTNGFETLEIAKERAEELKENLPDYNVTMELDDLIEWNGEGIPADTQLRTN